MQKEKSKGKKEEQGNKVRIVILNIIRILLIVAFLGAFYNGRKLILFISAFAFVVTFLPKIFKKVFDVELPAHFEVMILLFIYGTLFFGKVKGFYYQFWWWSALFSLSSAVALGFVGLAVMYALYKGDKIHGSPLIVAIFSFCFAVAIGTVWEFFEFSVDKLFGFSLQATGDTMLDLIAYMAGAFVVSSAGYFYIKNGKLTLISRLISKFIEKNPRIFGIKGKAEDHSKKIISLIEEGEGHKVEFKSTLRTNLHTNQIDKKMEHSVLKTISAYLNSSGGSLLIGVSDTGDIVGIENDNFPSIDKASLHVNSLIKDHIGGEFLPFIKSEVVNVGGKNVLKIDCEKSHKEVFLKNGNEEKFYVRNGASSVELLGRSLVDYIQYNFRNNNKLGD